MKAIYFEDVSLVKMKEFRMLLKTLREIPTILAPIIGRNDQFKSERLKNLLSTEQMFPSNLLQEIDQFDRLIIWKKVQGSDVEIPEP